MAASDDVALDEPLPARPVGSDRLAPDRVDVRQPRPSAKCSRAVAVRTDPLAQHLSLRRIRVGVMAEEGCDNEQRHSPCRQGESEVAELDLVETWLRAHQPHDREPRADDQYEAGVDKKHSEESLVVVARARSEAPLEEPRATGMLREGRGGLARAERCASRADKAGEQRWTKLRRHVPHDHLHTIPRRPPPPEVVPLWPRIGLLLWR